MSLGTFPSSTPSLVARPTPPSRSRRHILSTNSISDVASSKVDDQDVGMAGVLGGLRERSEDELKRAGRDALEFALKDSWEREEDLENRIRERESAQEESAAERESLKQAVHTLQARYDEALNEQARLDADIEGRDELLNLLRGRLGDAERQLRESAKRGAEQERSFNAERQALQAQESHLQQRIRTLLAARSTQSTPAPASTTSIEDLQQELASLNVSHSTILAQLNTLTKENTELKEINKTVSEENQGWEFLLRERTFSGKVLEGGLLGSGWDHPPIPVPLDPKERSQLDALDEELEKDELHSDLDAQSPIYEDEHGMADFDKGGGRDSMLSTSPESGHLRPPRRRKPKGDNLGDLPVTGSGFDLAAELGRAEVDLDGNEMRVLGKGDEGEALRTEVKQLREENKALTLYCSKIIDRIIAQEGFEHILSVDYKTRRMGSRSASAAGRGNLKDITSAMPAGDNLEKEGAVVPTSAEENKKARPLSLMARALSKTGAEDPAAQAEACGGLNEAAKTETKPEKRARRGFSLDFRSLGFGSSSASTTPTEQKSNPALKPLTLAYRTEVYSRAGSTSSAASKAIQARRLERQEEDEEDRKERHHLEATLKLMGVDKERQSTFSDSPPRPAPPRKLTKAQPRSASRGPDREPEGYEELERQNLIQASIPHSGSGSISPDSFQKGTPLSRLSSALGSTESPLSTIDAIPKISNGGTVSPELAAEALAKFDQREAEQVKMLSKGKAPSGYTTPSPGSIRRQARRTASDGERERVGSAERVTPRISGVAAAVGEHKFGVSGSISTLWSMGSSRPSSMEVAREPEPKKPEGI